MYSFRQHPDLTVVDEPLYGHYLRVSGARHPGRRRVMEAMNCDGDAVMRDLLASEKRGRRLFLKQMAHHIAELDLGFLNGCDHVLLIRDPKDMLPSLTVQLPDAELGDTGLVQQVELFDRIAAGGTTPAVIDAKLLQDDPRRTLTRACERLSIRFDPVMLKWPEGPKPEDGVWAPYWYDAVHRSTHFTAYRPKGPIPFRLRSLYEQTRPLYARLRAHAVGDEQ